MTKDIWFEIMKRGYDPLIPWEEKHIVITVGEKMIDRIYSLFNKEDFIEIKYIDFSEDDDLMTNFQIQKSWNDVTIGKSMLMGFCGVLEIIQSEKSNEFKIEFL